MAEYQHIYHTFEPVYDKDSKILILGSFPSVKSREQGFYYGHARNRFWKVLSVLLSCEEPTSIEEKKQMLLNNHIAVWDTIASCTIEGSSDSSIKNVVPTDLSIILSEAPDLQIFCNGATSHQYYRKYQEKLIGRQAIRLPSTSPANAAWSLERLKNEWNMIREYL